MFTVDSVPSVFRVQIGPLGAFGLQKYNRFCTTLPYRSVNDHGMPLKCTYDISTKTWHCSVGISAVSVSGGAVR